MRKFEILKSIAITLLVNASCASKNEHVFLYLREIENVELIKAIQEYSEVNALKPEVEFLTINFYAGANASFYVISKSKSIGGLSYAKPDYFSVVENSIVLLDFNSGQVVNTEGFREELEKFLKINGNNFEDELPTNFDPPTWVLVSCEGKYVLKKQVDMLFPNDLPCEVLTH